jgi:hypothetical protein
MTKQKTKRQKPKPDRGRGQPAWEPTDEDRDVVRVLGIAGFTEDKIADYIGKDAKTLRKHCRRELDLSTMHLGGVAVGKLAKAINDGEAWAICFFLKARLKWSERHELTGKDGANLFAGLDMTKLSDDDFNALKQILRRAGAAIED